MSMIVFYFRICKGGYCELWQLLEKIYCHPLDSLTVVISGELLYKHVMLFLFFFDQYATNSSF